MSLYDAAIERFLSAEPLTPDPALPESVRNLLVALTAPMNQPFSRELWMADAASLLPKVDIPVLIVIGKKDVQVDWQADGEPLQLAAKGAEGRDVSLSRGRRPCAQVRTAATLRADGRRRGHLQRARQAPRSGSVQLDSRLVEGADLAGAA